MAKRRKSEVVEQSSGDIFADLLGAVPHASLLNDAEMMHFNPKVRTPCIAINDALSGGIPFGGIIEAWGPTTAGKSTFSYQTVSLFQQDYKNGVVVIIDDERSTDKVRMELMGVDPKRVIRIPASTVEGGFEAYFAILNKKKKLAESDPEKAKIPVFVLWDTIAACVTRAQEAGGSVNSGGMTEKPRLLKYYLSRCFAEMEKQPVVLWLLNQATTSGFGTFHVGLSSSGGNALKHNVHIKLGFEDGKVWYDHAGITGQGKISTINIEKSKISPPFKGFPLFLDIVNGGIVYEDGSLMAFLEKIGLIPDRGGGWYYLNVPPFNQPDGTGKIPAQRKEDLFRSIFADKNGELYRSARNAITQYFYGSSSYLQRVYKEAGYRPEAWSHFVQPLDAKPMEEVDQTADDGDDLEEVPQTMLPPPVQPTPTQEVPVTSAAHPETKAKIEESKAADAAKNEQLGAHLDSQVNNV